MTVCAIDYCGGSPSPDMTAILLIGALLLTAGQAPATWTILGQGPPPCIAVDCLGNDVPLGAALVYYAAAVDGTGNRSPWNGCDPSIPFPPLETCPP